MSGTGGFQTQVQDQPAFAVAGDFASNNPWFSFDAGPGGLVAGAAGVKIGLFAWVYPPDDPDGTGKIVANSGAGPVAGFVHRAQQGLITTYLDFAGVTIKPGFQMGIMVGGDFWCVNTGTVEPVPGVSKAFANLADGTVQFAAPGTVIGGASATASSVAAETFSTTASINDDVLTVTAVGSGTVYPGSTIAAAGISAGVQIVKQLTGTPGGIGTYSLNVGDLSIASTTITGTYGLLTIGTATGVFAVGDILTGSGVVAGTAITANVTGSGGTGGTMVVNNNTVVSSTTITASVAVETKWYAMSSGQNGELVKISDHPLG
jgi:hypothetical protein